MMSTDKHGDLFRKYLYSCHNLGRNFVDGAKCQVQTPSRFMRYKIFPVVSRRVNREERKVSKMLT